MPIPLKLTVYKGSDLIGEHRFDRDIVKIGRLASAHLKLDDTKVSRIHAVIEATSDGHDYSIIDMGSTEGTFVNGEKVSKEKLKEGDEIRLGDCRLLVSFDEVEVRVPAVDVGAAQTAPAFATNPPPAPPLDPRELWSASASDLAQASPTMQIAPAQPSASDVTAIPAQYSVPPPSQTPADWSRISGIAGVPSAGFTVPQGVAAGSAVAAGASAVGPRAGAFFAPSAVPGQPPPPMSYDLPPVSQPAYSQVPAMPMSGIPMPVMHAEPHSPWGSVPNNLASDGVPENERALEIKLLWRDTILDTVAVTDQPVVTIGDERKTAGFGPFQKLVLCDLEVPSKGLPSQTFVLAQAMSPTGCTYTISIPSSFGGRVERADGTVIPLEDLLRSGRGIERGDAGGVHQYHLNPQETLYLDYGDLTFQVRYVRRQRFIPPPFLSDLNYSWINMLILAFFVHALAVISFIATPTTNAEMTESIFKNPNRFAQFRLTPEEKKKQQNDFLAKLKEGAAGAKAKGLEGKAGRKDVPKDKKGRMAVKGDPNDKEIAKSTLAKLFGAKGNTGRSYLFGSGGLGGELKGALGGVTGAEIGDAYGLGGLGTRGSGPGGGGLSMNSVGLGALGTAGRGGGQSGYGEGVGGLGRKADRDINISAGSPIIQGSLDKEIIRRVIKQHIAQIRYCYEKELTRSPGLFGKVATQFTISANGNVQSADVAQSTLNNAEVERCITSKIRTWVFPKPKGGGVVIVKYPFMFKTTG